MVVLLAVVGAVIVIVIALVAVGRESFTLGAQPKQALFDLEEAVTFVGGPGRLSPVPERSTDCGLPPAVSVTFRIAVPRSMRAGGANATSTPQVPPASTVWPVHRSAVMVNDDGLAPPSLLDEPRRFFLS